MQSLLPKRHRRIVVILCLVVLAALLLPSENNSPNASQRQNLDLNLKPQTNIELSQPSPNHAEPLLTQAPAPQHTLEPSSETKRSNQSSPNSVQQPVQANQPTTLATAKPPMTNQNWLEQVEQGEVLQLGMRYPLTLQLPPSKRAQANEKFYTLKRQTVKSGDSLALIFSRVGLSARTLYHIDQLGGEAEKLRTVHPGDVLDFYLDDNDRLVELRYLQSKYQTLVIKRDEQEQFHAHIDTQELEVRTNFAQGTISSSFWNAGINAHLSQGQIMALAAIFGWDIDFALDIRKNDSFTVLFEELYVDGEFAGHGDIIAAEFTNQGEVFRAVRYDDGNYYNPEGRPMRKAFLRAPVNFKYISSNFNPRRLHPVTGKVRAHNGIDYAARIGTPVQAAGDGRVTKSGYSKYNGNYVFIQHSSAYVTKYLHLNKRHVKTGQRVKQGKIIGTVGKTGRVTGPHLHYEFLVHGVHKNPRTVKLPTSKPLKGEQKRRFLPIAKARMTQLDNTKRVLLAMN